MRQHLIINNLSYIDEKRFHHDEPTNQVFAVLRKSSPAIVLGENPSPWIPLGIFPSPGLASDIGCRCHQPGKIKVVFGPDSS